MCICYLCINFNNYANIFIKEDRYDISLFVSSSNMPIIISSHNIFWISYFLINKVLFFLLIIQKNSGKTTREKLKRLSNAGDDEFDWLDLQDSLFDSR